VPGLKSRLAAFQTQGQTTARQWLDGLKQLRVRAGRNGRLIAAVVLGLLASTLLMMWLQPEAFGIGPSSKSLPKPVIAPPATLNAPPPVDPASTPAVAAAVPLSQPQPVVNAKATVTEAPDPAVQAQNWVRSLDPLSFLLQHGTTNTYENAVILKNKYPGLKQAEIVAAYRPGESLAHFVVVSGPYSQVGQGYEAAKRRDIPGNTWVRSTRTLQEQLKAP
jgi:hypothetical protein